MSYQEKIEESKENFDSRIKHHYSFFKLYLGILATILVLSVSYYFIIALPRFNQQKIAIEQLKMKKQEEEKITQAREIEDRERQRKFQLDNCVQEADTKYWDFVKLNGHLKPGTTDVYLAPQWVFDHAEGIKKNALEECYREYGR